jgi:hypothetical protein
VWILMSRIIGFYLLLLAARWYWTYQLLLLLLLLLQVAMNRVLPLLQVGVQIMIMN